MKLFIFMAILMFAFLFQSSNQETEQTTKGKMEQMLSAQHAPPDCIQADQFAEAQEFYIVSSEGKDAPQTSQQKVVAQKNLETAKLQALIDDGLPCYQNSNSNNEALAINKKPIDIPMIGICMVPYRCLQSSDNQNTNI
jgi:hypothetical protein